MAPIPPTPKGSLGNVLVIGGCGFLGSHIVSLLQRTTTSTLTVIDLHTTRNLYDKVTYHSGDITSLTSLLPLFQKSKPDVVIHTASPTLVGGSKEMYHKVNVEGTKCVIEACQKSGVKALVYTSSASVVSDNVSDLINADERWPVIPPSAQTEYYSQTKAEAEALVLAANRASTSPKLLTTALRPSGIFGPGDVQVLPPMIRVYYEGKTHFQLGDNSNLFDFTYVENVAHAHILAAAALLTTSSLNTQVLDHEKVDGETFFITNDSPVPFWDFARLIWRTLDLSPSSRNINKEGKREVRGTEGNWVIGKEIGLVLGTVLEWGMWLVGRKSRLTAREVKYSCMTRYYDIGKANKRLGYVPIVGLEEGVKRGVAWFEEREREEKEKVGTGLGEKKGL